MSVGGINQSVGLALLTGGLGGAAAASPVESRAVRLARAQFTLPAVTPPWQQKVGRTSDSLQLAAIRRMGSIVEGAGGAELPADVRMAFTAYQALDRLRVLASAGLQPRVSGSERSSLDALFAKGLEELQAHLAAVPRDRLSLAFGAPGRKVDSLSLPAAGPDVFKASAVASTRSGPLPGLTGQEVFDLRLARTGTADSFRVDLSTLPQPPTLDDIASALNGAIGSVPLTDAGGSVVLDADGNPRPKWSTSFAVVKSEKGWGLELRTMGIEQVSVRNAGAGDALMVAAVQTGAGTVPSTAMLRFDVEADGLRRTNLSDLSASDADATAAARLLPLPGPLLPGTAVPAPTVPAPTVAGAAITDPDGFTYVVGTSRGDLGGQVGDGAEDLFLTKLDRGGAVMWQRTLGTPGTAAGSAVILAPGGDIVVVGTAHGDVDGANADGDMLVARFAADGEERFATLVRAVGADQGRAITLGQDGSIVIGGQTGAGEAVVARIDAAGRLAGRTVLAGSFGESVRALQTAADGSLLALVQSGASATIRRLSGSLAETGAVTLGSFDARALAVDAASGRIAVGGTATDTGSRDGLVLHLDSSFAEVSRTRLETAADDQVDSLAFAAGSLYVGGRTSGTLGSARVGSSDGFVAAINLQTHTVSSVSQWGRPDTSIGSVVVAAAPGAGSGAALLGFRPGVLNPAQSPRLVAQTSLRAGDSFAIRIDGGKRQTVTIGRNDTLDDLLQRISAMAKGGALKVSAARQDGGRSLRLEAQAGHAVELLAGPEGRDALAKLGLSPQRLIAPALLSPKAPRVQPGGNYGLELSTALNLKDPVHAKLALDKVQAAISTTQSAFRSLYWDDNKAALVNGQPGGRVSSYQAAQLGRYQDALNRLGGGY